MLKNKRARAGYRGVLAVLLCVALALESAPLTTWAAEETPVFEGTSKSFVAGAEDVGENGNAEESGASASKEGDDDAGEESGQEEENPGKEEDAGWTADTPQTGDEGTDNPADLDTGTNAGGDKDPSGGGDTDNPGSAGDDTVGGTDVSGDSGLDTDTPADDDSDAPVKGDTDTPDDGGADTPADGDTDIPVEGETEQIPPADGDADVPADGDTNTPVGEEPEQVSENSLETVSENTVETISENSLDTGWQEAVKEAEEAFDSLVSEKALMALLYRTESYGVREEADEDSRECARAEIGDTLYIKGVRITEDDIWYRVRYLSGGSEGVGYVQSYYLAYADEDWIAWEEEHLRPVLELCEEEGSMTYGARAFSTALYAADSSDISAFPGSYQSALRELKNTHPNWTFVPMKTGLDFQTAVSKEMGDKSLIQKTSNNSSKGWVGEPCPSESGWNYATKPAVSYHMDPRNFLTETHIFQFEQLTFNGSYHTEAAVQSFLNNTFMKGKLPDDAAGRTYAKAFYEIGSGRKLSPIHLASRVYQEQGQGTSGLISGTYPGYEGYYNFFNVGVNGASTAEKIVKGLTYAKNKGWNSRYKSLEGGASTIGNNYILKGQDTIYLEKFNVNKNSPYGLYEHQYMQNIQAPASESSSTRKMYANAGSINSAFVFKIPVFENMPGDSGEEPDVPDVPLQGISLDKGSVTLKRPDTVIADTTGLSEAQKAENISDVVLQASFLPADTTSDKTLAWSSSNAKVATVKADPSDPSKAVVTAVGAGEAVITAKASKAGGMTATCQVKVIAPIYKLELSDPGAEEGAGKTVLYAGQSVSLNAEYWPKDTTSDKTVAWSSSDESIVAVRNGRVTAGAAGGARITAAVGGYTASWDVEVKGCSVIFHKAGGAVLESVSLGYGKSIADTPTGRLPEAEKQSGSIFRGWYTKAEGQGSVFSENTPVYAQETHVYPHYQKVGGGFYVIPVGDQIYTGSAIKPKVQVFDGTVAPDGSLIGQDQEEVLALVEGRDYTLSYKNNKNVNAEGAARPTIIVKGKGNYTGTRNVYFDILPKALTDHDIEAQDITAAYTGRTIKSAPAVYRNGKKLAANRDYTCTYPQTGTGAYSKTGVYPIVITGKGGYKGKITIYETITSDVLLGKVSVARIPKLTYNSEQLRQEGGIRPDALTVTYKRQPLVKGQHYTVSYSGDQGIGKATVTLTAVPGSGYAGSKSVTYQIVGTSIAKAKVEGLTDKEYVEIDKSLDVFGAEYEKEYQKMRQTQGSYRLTLDDRVLEESKDGITGDYVVSYAGAAQRGAVRAGAATIVFKGINEFSGQLKKTYRITPCELRADRLGGDGDFTLAYYTQDAPGTVIGLTDPNGITTPYMKGGSKPAILVSFGGLELVQGKDYTVSYKNNNALTTSDMEPGKLPVYTVKGKGNFKGTITGNFTVTDGKFDGQSNNKGKITMTLKDVVYREKKGAYKTKAVLRDANGAALAAGKDYDKNLQYTYETETEVLVPGDGELVRAKRNAGEIVGEEDMPQAGTSIRVTAQGIGAYAGEGQTPPRIYAVYRIVTADFAKAKVAVPAKSYQDGRPVTLTADDLTVTLSGAPGPLVLGVDYEIEEESYINHTKKGRAKVTLRGIGNYGGEKTVTYTIGAKVFWW